ncbi:T9SS C-terminal target domain-containing protein [Pontibacter cellulosilyticus]|uniref:T9SS C-terminal target domain-containing protein n=1 Tax=Pontibacter cellulosilyticus TaxID=1720253 RepID=A0A923N7F3_9BACT|nr:T9SS C-terminal target domain-containing protein [Pontibacter cellulosilyticus]MBC5992806.1 T9SS C-terminal target domain-containing protein [Pontibacter cellulosilyticus]
MKKLLNLVFVALFSVAFFACDDEETTTPTPTGLQFTTAQENGMTVISGSTEENYTMKAGTKYMLKGFVYVKDGATLTIEPGTVIKGDKATKGTLVIERGGKIMAEGTAAKPIVFTSAQPAGSRAAGDWGGIIILGKAPVNLGANAMIEGGIDRAYGGTDAADNSGVLKYVRIEYPGIAFQPDNEINGLTMGGVGSGTTIDYVQISYSGDDSFEWFGGTVNAKHLIAYKTVDDMFDTDNGYSGKLQYLVGISDPNVADASGSNGFESDNDSQGSATTPVTSPTYSNVTLFGPLGASSSPNSNFKRALHLRRNNKTKLHNSIVLGFPTGLLLDGTATETNATNNEFKIQNTVIAAPSGKALTLVSGSTFDINTWFNATAKGNAVVNDASTLGINGAYNASPNFVKATTSVTPSFTGLDSFFDQVDFVGAFGANNWTAGWANFNPQSTNY